MDNENLIEELKSKLFKTENDLKVKIATEAHLIYDNENLIEELKSKLFKTENDLKVKIATEAHLIYDNENLFAENEKLTQDSIQAKETIDKLNLRVKKLTCDAEEIVFSQDEKECLEKEIENLKDNLNRQIKLNKELSKPIPRGSNSPDVRMRDQIYKYECTVAKLREEKSLLMKKIEDQDLELNNMKTNVAKEVEILNHKLENYKQLLETAKEEKDEIENEYMMYQTDVNQPDFKRQGNSLYVEVNDRRILAETKLLEYQSEIIRLRSSNKSLRIFLEDIFEEYRIMTDDENLNIRVTLREQVNELTKEKTQLQSDFNKLDNYIKDKLKKTCDENPDESVVISGLIIQKGMLERSMKSIEFEVVDANHKIKELEKSNSKLYKTNMKLFRENANLLTKVSDFETKLVCWEQIVPADKKVEYEAKQKEVEESLSKGAVLKECQAMNLPPEAFGKVFADAKYQDVLVFDVFGRPIQNRLTRRVLEKSAIAKAQAEEEKAKELELSGVVTETEVKTQKIAEPQGTDAMKSSESKVIRTSVFKENVNPEANNNLMDLTDCKVS